MPVVCIPDSEEYFRLHSFLALVLVLVLRSCAPPQLLYFTDYSQLTVARLPALLLDNPQQLSHSRSYEGCAFTLRLVNTFFCLGLFAVHVCSSFFLFVHCIFSVCLSAVLRLFLAALFPSLTSHHSIPVQPPNLSRPLRRQLTTFQPRLNHCTDLLHLISQSPPTTNCYYHRCCQPAKLQFSPPSPPPPRNLISPPLSVVLRHWRTSTLLVTRFGLLL